MKRLYILSILAWVCPLWATPNVYQYRIYCNTEAQNVYQWGQQPPTTCPNNTAHSINLNSISIVDEQGPSLFTLKEESTPTGGNYGIQSEVMNANAGPNVSTSLEFSWPFDISVLAIYMLPKIANDSDIVTITIGANMVYGTISQNIAAGATVIPVSSTVISTIAKGYYVTLSDGTNADSLGRVIGVDSVGNAITVESATVHSFAAATPTQVQVSVVPVNALELVSGLQYTIGMKKIGASFIPANTVVTVNYLNMSSVLKKLVLTYEYLY